MDVKKFIFSIFNFKGRIRYRVYISLKLIIDLEGWEVSHDRLQWPNYIGTYINPNKDRVMIVRVEGISLSPRYFYFPDKVSRKEYAFNIY